MITGRITIVPAAATSPHRIPSKVIKLVIATVAVLVLSPVRINEYKNSFQDMMNENILAAAIPGADNGIVTLIKAINRDTPSILAASSRSTEMLSK